MKRWSALLLSLLILWGASGCASSGSSGAPEKESAVSGTTMQENEAGAPGDSLDLAPQTEQTRKLIKNVELKIQTKTYDAFMDGLQAGLAAQGGYVQQSNMSGSGEGEKSRRSATIVVRVPADKLDAFLSAVSSNGVVTSRSENVQDVTMEYVDAESRLAALRAEQESLLALLEKAGSLQDILTVQDRLTQVRGEIESYEAKLRTMETLVAHSTVTIRVYEVEKEPEAAEKGMWQEIGDGFLSSLKAVGRGLRAIFVWFMSALPFLAVAAAVTGVVLLIVRMALRRSRKKQAKARDYMSPAASPQAPASSSPDDPAGQEKE